MNKDFVFSTSLYNKVGVSAFGIESVSEKPCIIFVHGFKGFKDWGFFPFLGQVFAEKGYFVLTFNFSHNGVGDNLLEFDELDKFSKNTFSLEKSEIEELISAYKIGFFGRPFDERVFLVGHSRGGAISLLSSYNNSSVVAVAIWGCVSDLDRYSQRQKEKWRQKGVFEVLNARTRQKMKLNVTILDDIESNKYGSLNIENAVRELKKPLLIIHGEQDLAVPIEEAELLFSWSDKSISEFYRIKHSGHTFNIKHPFEGSNQKFDKVIQLTENFLNNIN